MANFNPSKDHKNRVKQELAAAGVSRYGLLKMEARHLPEIIHPDEKIEAVAYGISDSYSTMLVATDRRVIFWNRKPFYTMSDELTYEMVAGVGYNIQAGRAAVTLHTRLGDYAVRFVNRKAAEKFVTYIEQRRLEVMENGEEKPALQDEPQAIDIMDEPVGEDGIKFLRAHSIATLSTIDRTGNVHGAVIYYFVDGQNNIYVLTKSDTRKAHNIFAHHQVALTVYNETSRQTLQLQGLAEVESDPGVKDFVHGQLSQPKKYAEKVDLPPVAKLNKGSFTVIKIRPTAAVFHDFSK